MEVSGTLLSSWEIYQGFRSPSDLSEYSVSSLEPSLTPSASSREDYEGLMSPGWWDLTLRNDDTEDLDGGDYSSAANPRTRLELAAATNNFSDDRMQGSIGMGRNGRAASFQSIARELQLEFRPFVQHLVLIVKMKQHRGVSKQLMSKLLWRTFRALIFHVPGGDMLTRKAIRAAANVPGVTAVDIRGKDIKLMLKFVPGQGIDVFHLTLLMQKMFGFAELAAASII